MRIERVTESKQSTAFYHKIADIPAGVTVKTADFPNGGTIAEGTPLIPAADGLYTAAVSAKVVEAATDNATKYSVAKGHLLKVGDKLQKAKTTTVNITAIDTSDAAKDVITVDGSLGAKGVNTLLSASVSGEPVAVVGEAVTFKKGDNVMVSAWVIAVINKNIVAEPAVRPAGVLYV